MIALLLAVVMTRFDNKDLLRKVIPDWTGMNGYEEYILAAIEADRLEASKYRYFVGASGNQSIEPPKFLATVSEPLEQDHLASIKFEDLMRYVRRGNTKPVFYPVEDMTLATLMPELSYFRSYVPIFLHDANWRLASGERTKGANDLLEALTFASKLPSKTLIHVLVRRGICRQAMLPIYRLIPRLSRLECESLAQLYEQFNEPIGQLEEVFTTERQAIYSTIVRLGNGREELGWHDKELRELRQRFTEDDNRQLRRLAEAYATPYRQATLSVLRLPESEWDVEISEPGQPNLDRMLDECSLQVVLFFKMVQETMGALMYDSDDTEFACSLAYFREQNRIMALHLRIAAYQWEHDHFPGKLADAVPADEAMDPITGNQFVYQLTPEGYDLYSTGYKGRGRIDLEHSFKSNHPEKVEKNP